MMQTRCWSETHYRKKTDPKLWNFGALHERPRPVIASIMEFAAVSCAMNDALFNTIVNGKREFWGCLVLKYRLD